MTNFYHYSLLIAHYFVYLHKVSPIMKTSTKYILLSLLVEFVGQKVKFPLYSRFKNFILGVVLIFVFYITTFWLTMMGATYFLCPEHDRRYCMELTQLMVFIYTIDGKGIWLFTFTGLLLGTLLIVTNDK